MKTSSFSFLMVLTLGGVWGLAQAGSAITESTSPTKQCQTLANMNFSDVQDAPTQIISTKFIRAERDVPDYCEVSGYVAPQVGFEMRLPLTDWNGKFLEQGCGGDCGDAIENLIIATCPLRRGYACIASDAGHKGSWFDALWGYGDWQAKVDFGYRAPHVAALAGKAIIERFYHVTPKKSYFIGLSTGGRQALQEAQRFPWDFDGIIAISPPTDLSTIYMTFAWGMRVTHDKDGNPFLTSADLKLVTDAALAQCDQDDGVKDGIISDPLHCALNLAKLACALNQSSGCLSSMQIDAVAQVYAGPMTSSGMRLSLGGPVVGSEFGGGALGGWETIYNSSGPMASMASEISNGLRYLFFLPELGPTWKLSEFDFDHDYKRLEVMEVLYDSSNPDLRKFNSAGGKLMIFQGLNDTSVPPQSIIDYYETVERTMGGRTNTQSFARLFLVPGVDHGLNGVGAGLIDSLSALEAWVEDGNAPDRLIATHLKGDKDHSALDFSDFPPPIQRIQFTRPVFSYPNRAKYRGKGDTNNYENFVALAP
jgi:pimeloyl-ACP methyl ester carboxylesterase